MGVVPLFRIPTLCSYSRTVASFFPKPLCTKCSSKTADQASSSPILLQNAILRAKRSIARATPR